MLNLHGEREGLYTPLYNPEDLQKLTTDTNVQYILDFNWGNEQRYLRIPQDLPVKDSFYNKVTSINKINLKQEKPILLGLRTSLSKPDIFKNCSYDTQIEFITFSHINPHLIPLVLQMHFPFKVCDLNMKC